MIERLFHLTEHSTTVRTEVVAGVTTSLTMAYIISVQPTMLSAAGMDFGAALVATCLASGIAISYADLKIATGRRREAHALVYLFAVLFVLRYEFLTT